MLAFSYPVLCIHFIPNFSWDDLWAYIALIWVVYFFLKEKYFLTVIFFSFAILSRESSVLILPFFYFYKNQKGFRLSHKILLSMSIAAYLLYRMWLFPDFNPNRFSNIINNFVDLNSTKQSLYSLFISFGYLWIASFVGYKSLINKNAVTNIRLDKNFFLSAFIISILCIIVILFSAQARETRLFFIPFIFLIPLALSTMDNIYLKTKALFNEYSKIIFIIISLILFILLIIFSVIIFPVFSFLPMIDFHRVLFAIHLFIICIILFLTIKKTG